MANGKKSSIRKTESKAGARFMNILTFYDNREGE